MADPGTDHTTPSAVDGDGVRIVRLQSRSSTWRRALPVLGLALLVASLAYLMTVPPAPLESAVPAVGKPAAAATGSEVQTSTTMTIPEPVAPAHATAAPAQTIAPPVPINSVDTTQRDPNDLANYIRPGDQEPTGAELIQALRDAGEREGIAAFNPPGTSPPLPGLAVPEDYNLPPGYVRHHQVTDQGEPIEAILMYAPDAVIHDAAGRLISIPEDRVVPPELAPPGLPIRQVEIPTP